MAEKKTDKKNTASERRRRAVRGENTKKSAAPSLLALLVGGCAGVLLTLFLIVSTVTMYAGDRTLAKEGLTVLGMDVGGKSQKEIETMLTDADIWADFEVKFECADAEEVLTAEDVSLVLDIPKTAEAAVMHGRKNIFGAFGSLFSSKEIQLVYTYDYIKLAEVSVSLSTQCGGSLKQHEVIIEGDSVRIKPGAAGTGVDLNEVQKNFEEAVLLGGGTYTMQMTKAQPVPIDVDSLHKMVYCEPADAHYSIDGKEVIVTPEVDGRDFDKAEAKRQLAGLKEGGPEITVALNLTPAKVKAADINKTLFADELGKFSTKYATSNRSRATNVELAAQFVDGTILLPGDEFSYNKIVGERTYERGFRAASIYENNKMVDGLGGGICQTSSTIYAAVLYADLEITERHEHMLEVHYAPLGMDATVAYGSLDFRFKNNTSAPVKIVCKASAGVVNVQVMGTNEHPGRTVEIKTERISYTPYGTTTVNDETLQPGQQVQDGEGFNGAVVNTYKIITENGKQISNTLLHKSVYRMVNRILRVGPTAADPNVPTVTDPSQAVSGGDVVIEGDQDSAQEIYDQLQIPDGI